MDSKNVPHQEASSSFQDKESRSENSNEIFNKIEDLFSENFPDFHRYESESAYSSLNRDDYEELSFSMEDHQSNDDVIKKHEESMRNFKILQEAERFINNPSTPENIFFPNFQYFEAKLSKEVGESFDEYLKRILREELEREELVSNLSQCSLNSSKNVTGKNINNSGKEDESGVKRKRMKICYSPDLFPELEDNENNLKLNNMKMFTQTEEPGTSFGSNNRLLNEAELLSILDFPQSSENQDANIIRHDLLDKIEKIIFGFLDDLTNERPTTFFIKNSNKWTDHNMEDNVLSLNSDGSFTQKKISSHDNRTKSTFSMMIYLLGEIYHLLSTNSTCTLRELYYRNPELTEDENKIAKLIKDICVLLDAKPWELGIVTTSKGFIAGSIEIKLFNNEIIKIQKESSNGASIPQDVARLKSINTAAKLILLVEKDTIFKHLIQHGIFDSFEMEILLITGKGYPDINTRVLIRKIWDQYKLPIYALVDADPFGIEIFLVYKYGSREMSYNVNSLACPDIRWIGIYPSEIDIFDIPSINLNSEDKKRIDDLLKRPYINDSIKDELMLMKRTNKKAEIEGVLNFYKHFLIKDYICGKIERNFVIRKNDPTIYMNSEK